MSDYIAFYLLTKMIRKPGQKNVVARFSLALGVPKKEIPLSKTA
jgi:hypothetical protein